MGSEMCIRDSTGGATDKPDTNADIIVISIHAPTGGATHFNDRYYNDFTEFQSTLPRGERLYPPLALNGDGADISIHAPTGGATKRITLIMADRTYFNPRSHGGSDGFSSKLMGFYKYFNPRSHGGSDSKSHQI